MPEAVKRLSGVQKSYELIPQNDKDNSVIVTKQPTIVESPAPPPLKIAGYEPFNVNCPKCKHDVETVIRFHITEKTHACVFCLSILTWPIAMCFVAGIPYCLKWCQAVEHICPNCNATLGKYSKF